MTRRQWMYAAGPSILLAQDRSAKSDVQARIRQIIHAYEEQGSHRTGTEIDRVSGDWLASEVRRVGLSPALEPFEFSRVDPAAGSISVDGRRIEGLPLFDGAFTDAAGVNGVLGPLGSDASIGLGGGPPNSAEAGQIGDARRQNRHRAIVFVTRGGRPGLCPSKMRTAS